MERPADVTQDMIDTWEVRRLMWSCEEPCPKEVYYAGHYIAHKLRELGCNDDSLIHRICEAAGQRQANSTTGDFWGVAKWIIEEYKQGRWEEPGPELAVKLFYERFGENPDPAAILSAMAANVPEDARGPLFERIMTLRFMMAYGPSEAEQHDEAEVVNP